MRADTPPEDEDDVDDQRVTPQYMRVTPPQRGNRLRTRVGEIDVPDVVASGELETRALTPIPILVDDDD